ncbi:ATP-binding protein [Sphingopyxis sp.]|uniref:ATP-binding protein n=1 Tax=Sphingopyxis sp. TaxID=1908224 RepID=UPI003BAAC02F
MEVDSPRGFTVAARTILELGAELISSDSIALYELIKNAYDAGSKRAVIEITNVFRHSSLRNQMARIDAACDALERQEEGDDEDEFEEVLTEEELVEKLRGEAIGLIDPTAPVDARSAFVSRIEEAQSLLELKTCLQRAYEGGSRIEILDTGEGMSAFQLQDIFLRIGTRSRLDGGGQRHFVGGKGIGRLSAMRLADKLDVVTTRSGEDRWNILQIDWTRFTHDSATRLEDIDFAPEFGDEKEDESEQGTKIILTRLKADWDIERVRRIVTSQMDRLFDPFGDKARYPISILVNGQPIPIPSFDRRLLTEAQAKGEINYYVDETGPHFVLKIEYLAYGRETTVDWDENDLLGITANEDVSLAAMRSLGNFKAHFHWFNRQKLTQLEGVGTRAVVRDIVNHWANGLLMYRDGFRVNPYGGPNDDWLGIDFKALGSAGYKVNRKQLIGAVNITSKDNPYLIDQTNREGLRANEEKALLVLMLQKAVTETFRNFLNAVEREERAKTRMDVKDTTAFLEGVSARTKRTLKSVRALLPSDRGADMDFLDATFGELEERLKTARDALTTAAREQRDLVNLAGIGLLVEIVSHELGRVAKRTLDVIGSIDRSDLARNVSTTFDTVESQMLVIRRRLDMLDPLSPSGRNRREVFDLRELVTEVLDSHENQFRRHDIRISLDAGPLESGSFNIRAVKGMIVQVMENLIDNSVFWLKQKQRADPSFKARILVEIDAADQELRFTDNGPGIPVARAEEVFMPFVSSKPPGEGKGLGLYISREIARYHASELYLFDAPRDGRLNTFVLDIDGLR